VGRRRRESVPAGAKVVRRGMARPSLHWFWFPSITTHAHLVRKFAGAYWTTQTAELVTFLANRLPMWVDGRPSTSQKPANERQCSRTKRSGRYPGRSSACLGVAFFKPTGPGSLLHEQTNFPIPWKEVKGCAHALQRSITGRPTSRVTFVGNRKHQRPVHGAGFQGNSRMNVPTDRRPRLSI